MALESNRKAIELNDALPEPHRALGMIYYKNGDKPAAKEHLERYLMLAPKASDKTYILNYMKALE